MLLRDQQLWTLSLLKWSLWDSNPRPPGYEPGALTNWAKAPCGISGCLTTSFPWCRVKVLHSLSMYLPSNIEQIKRNRTVTTHANRQPPSRIELRSRERMDSNHRNDFSFAGFQDQCNQPLCHVRKLRGWDSNPRTEVMSLVSTLYLTPLY